MKKNMLNITQAQLDEDGLAIIEGWISVYSVSRDSREYIGVNSEYLAVGVGIPAGSYIDAPMPLDDNNKAIRRTEDGKAWEAVTDLRDQAAYRTDSGQLEPVNYLGDLPDTHTLLAPQTTYDFWNGDLWVTDTKAQHVAAIQIAEDTKKQLLNEAAASIAPLQDAIDTELATDSEKEQLIAWKTYRVLLNRIDISVAPDIEWPLVP
ncbi:tail fiber assembly protein [Yersinia vastinensis]|uniref:tail fiber assembly protein n=1 Tax=Yersinia vastinensis TaxID=2890318 RepID=UPI0005E3DC08|nr:tail fiber assembly protein [Yersinia vastinensis]CNJ99897.1 tail fiber assembly protein G [Yersinia frederiksenii]